VVVIDALAARQLPPRHHFCFAIPDFPGSGVDNGRAAIEEKTRGSRVFAIGVPTVWIAGEPLRAT
jgi:hypothetical protein